MKVGNDAVADIKARLSIEEVVARYVPLKRAGRSLKALCPFHAEKSPSFVVSPDRQLAYCFGCHKGGDLFQFIQEMEGVDFKQALRILAEHAGIDLSSYSVSVGASPSKDHRDRLIQVNDLAGKFFQEQLNSTKEGALVLQYLEKRGIQPQTIQDFELGYAPDSFDATSKVLLAKGCAKEDLLELGLLTARQTDGRSTYDRFRGRLMFPIRDVQGRLIGFGGRTLKEGSDEAKYLNSPDSMLYHKGEGLYGLHQAKAALRQVGRAVVVEGYMDVLASHQAGVAYVVASSGTAFTLEQFKLIQRFVSAVIFSFDTDRAGEEALRRAVEVGQPLHLDMKVLRVPEGKDPDECIRENPALWTEAIESAQHYLDYYLRQIESRYKEDALEAQRLTSELFFPLLKGVSPLERDHFLQQLSFALQAEPTVVYDEFRQFSRGKRVLPKSSEGPSERSVTRAPFSSVDYFFGLLLRFIDKLDLEKLQLPEALFDEGLKKIYKSVLDHYNNAASWDVGAFLQSLPEEERVACELRMIFAESQNADLSEEAIRKETEQVAVQLTRQHRNDKIQALMREIQTARRAKDAEQERRLFQAYSDLLQTP